MARSAGWAHGCRCWWCVVVDVLRNGHTYSLYLSLSYSTFHILVHLASKIPTVHRSFARGFLEDAPSRLGQKILRGKAARG